VVWAVALLTALPIPIVSRLDQPDQLYSQCGFYICTEVWPGQAGPWRLDGETQKYYYSMALMIFQYFIPVSALVLTYARIALVIWGGRTPLEFQGDVRAQRMARSKKKVSPFCLISFITVL
jgi:neuropeptide Y receptor